MKYRQLTKEQFEGLHEEFAHFLATQSIDAKEWNQIKKEKPTYNIWRSRLATMWSAKKLMLNIRLQL